MLLDEDQHPPGVPRLGSEAMNVGDIMVKDVVTVAPETPVRQVATLMLERRISGVPVVDDERRVLGIVSEGDLIRRPEIETDHAGRGWLGIFVSAEDRARDFVKSHGRKAGEVMTRPAICVAPDTPLTEIVRLMERNRVKRLVVVEHGKLAGLVTRADLLRAMLAHQDVALAASSDQALRARIDRMLRDEDWANSAYVHVQVEKGVAHLWGTVESAAQREALIVAVRQVPGVRDVAPHLGRSMPG
jgi:CBS domain-containing protein